MLQPAPKVGHTAKQYAAGLLIVREQRLRKVRTGRLLSQNRVFYKELKEDTYKIIDANIILLTYGIRIVPYIRRLT